MRGYIDEYLESYKGRWSPTTLKSEKYRLSSLADLLDGDAEKLYVHLENTMKSRYSILTTFIRVGAFWDWGIKYGYFKGQANPYKEFKHQNSRHFKNAYQRRTSEISYKDAVERIKSLKNPEIESKALQMLSNGLRYSESFKIVNGQILGKGDKIRDLFGDQTKVEFKKHYQTFSRYLKSVGLRPHDLRKIFASQLVRQGINEYDLCKIMGWSKLDTAKFYVAARRKEELKDFVKNATKI